MDELQRLQSWFHEHCDGDWEHGSGIQIATLDNPGWSVDIELEGTNLEDHRFVPVTKNPELDATDWYDCRIEDSCFRGRGGASNLGEILSIFLGWAGR